MKPGRLIYMGLGAPLLFSLASPVAFGTSGHSLIHLSIVLLFIALLNISAVSYLRNRRRRLLFVLGAFATLTAREVILLLNSALFEVDFTVPIINTEVTHFMGLWVALLFTLGVTKG